MNSGSERGGRVTILPELSALLVLGLLSLAPLLLSSGAEVVDWLVYHRGGIPTLFTLEPLVGLDSALHWTARLLIALGVANVVVRRIGPYASYRRHIAASGGRPVTPGTELHRSAVSMGCADRVRVLPAVMDPVAFTAGLLRPRIYLSSTLVERLEPTELSVLLAHENHHRRSFDPLRVFLTTVLSDLFFWIPVARSLTERVVTKVEFAADGAVPKRHRLALARTIVKVAGLGVPRTPVGVTSFSGTAALAARVRRLVEARQERMAVEVGARRAGATALVVFGLWALGLTAFGTHTAHLEDDGGSQAVVEQAGSPF